MKLNPSRCVFAIKKGKVLGFWVSSKSIKPNLEKIRAILGMTPLLKVKKVQCLTERLATLNKFIYRLGERSLPFFKILKNITNFEWTPEYQKAFEKCKPYLSSLKILS